MYFNYDQVDVLDLKSNPDGDYAYILHCMDHITGFHWLFPLAQIDSAEVAQNLVWGIFSLFGFPTELVSEYGKGFATQVIDEVNIRFSYMTFVSIAIHISDRSILKIWILSR